MPRMPLLNMLFVSKIEKLNALIYILMSVYANALAIISQNMPTVWKFYFIVYNIE